MKIGRGGVRPTVVDFETERILDRPNYPPRPVGISIKQPFCRARYFAFGHPTANNCTEAQARAAAAAVWGGPLVAHNDKFDFDVAETHWGLPWPELERTDDTMVLAYLDNPHERNIDLKNLSVRHLGRPAEERDELKEWILKNVKESAPSTWAGYISRAPGDMVGRYACADGEMTDGLLDVLLPKVLEAGMEDAYRRERELLRVLVGMERRGIPVDAARLAEDVRKYEA